MRSSEDHLEPLATQPRDGDVCLVIPGGDQQRIVGALLEPHHDLLVRDLDLRRGVDEVAEQMPRLGDLVAVADADWPGVGRGCWPSGSVAGRS